MTIDAHDPTLSAGKRLAFFVLLLAFVVVAIEGTVFVANRTLLASALSDVGDVPETPDLHPGREQAGLGFRDPSMCLHPFLGYVFLPRNERADPGPGTIAISADGFLDEKSPVRKRREGALIVGVLGGSVAGQLGTWHAARFEDALRRHPEFQNVEFDFVWLGMPGYHQPQQTFQLSYVLAQGGEFDLVINLDGFNELAVPCALNAPQGAHPLYPMNWSMVALDVPDADVRRHVGAITYLREERARRATAFHASFWSFSPTAQLLFRRSDDAMASRIAAHAWDLQQIPTDEIPFFVRGPKRAHVPVDEMLLACTDTWKRCSIQMNALCAAHGVRYLHVLQPNQYDPDSKPLSSKEKESAFEAESPYRSVIESGYPLLRSAGEELSEAGVEFRDLSRIFGNVEETLYVDNCCHFNGEGNRILAEAIANEAARLWASS
jgi:hypothetical protein